MRRFCVVTASLREQCRDWFDRPWPRLCVLPSRGLLCRQDMARGTRCGDGISVSTLLQRNQDLFENDVKGFEEVSKDLLISQHWQVLHVGRLRRLEHTTRSEGRALVWSICHATRKIQSHAIKHLFLVDKMSLCLAATKGRSSSEMLLPTLRFIAVVSLATGHRFITRWVPSEYNAADGPSRGWKA